MFLDFPLTCLKHLQIVLRWNATKQTFTLIMLSDCSIFCNFPVENSDFSVCISNRYTLWSSVPTCSNVNGPSLPRLTPSASTAITFCFSNWLTISRHLLMSVITSTLEELAMLNIKLIKCCFFSYCNKQQLCFNYVIKENSNIKDSFICVDQFM